MIPIFFPARARAGEVAYLLKYRQDRVVKIVGFIHSFAAIAEASQSENPTTAGAICFECEVRTHRALTIAQFWVHKLFLAGADIGAIPHIFVVHHEPCSSGGFRTVVHYVILNYHLGLKCAIRPYLDRIDRSWLEPARREMNKCHDLRDPDKCPRVIDFSRQHFQPDQAVQGRILADAKKWVLANGNQPVNRVALETRLEDYIAEVRGSASDLKNARLRIEPKNSGVCYYVDFAEENSVYIGRSVTPPPKRICAKKKENHVDFHRFDIDEFARWRRSEAIRLKGNGWIEERFAPDLERKHFYDLGRDLDAERELEEALKILDELELNLNAKNNNKKKNTINPFEL